VSNESIITQSDDRDKFDLNNEEFPELSLCVKVRQRSL